MRTRCCSAGKSSPAATTAASDRTNVCAPPTWEPTMTERPALLPVRELNAWYGESHALHGIDLDVHEGETVTLLGRNGVGKTTALRAIVGIIRKRSGSIRVDGKDMLRVPLHRTTRHGIGYVPEERGIFSSLTVEENLT